MFVILRSTHGRSVDYIPQVLPVSHAGAPALSEKGPPLLDMDEKSEIFFLTSGLWQEGQIISFTTLALRTSSSNGLSHSVHSNSKIGIIDSSWSGSFVSVLACGYHMEIFTVSTYLDAESRKKLQIYPVSRDHFARVVGYQATLKYAVVVLNDTGGSYIISITCYQHAGQTPISSPIQSQRKNLCSVPFLSL